MSLVSYYPCIFLILHLSLNMYDHFIIFPIYTVAFEYPCLLCLIPTREKKESEGYYSFKSPGNHISWRGRACNSRGRHKKNGCPALGPYLWDQKHQSTVRAKVPNICMIGSFLPTLTPEGVSRVPQEQVHRCLPQGLRWGWIAATVLRAKNDPT